jgi:hypothetical protein
MKIFRDESVDNYFEFPLKYKKQIYFKVMRNSQNISGSGFSSFLSHYVLAVSLLRNDLLVRSRLSNFWNYFLENTSDCKFNISRYGMLSCSFFLRFRQSWKILKGGFSQLKVM